jgi:hypothetical protein
MTLLAKTKIKCIYDIKKSTTNYINAIARYGKKVSIDKIDGVFVVGDQFNCADVPVILQHDLKENFSIECSSSGSDSTFDAFPLLDAKKILSEVPREMIENPPKVIEQSNKLISRRLDWLDGPAYERPGCFQPKNPDPLTQHEATLLLTQLQDKYKDRITGGMHFPKHKTILFQFSAQDQTVNFLLSYGEKTSFKIMSQVILDIDEGFKIMEKPSAGEKNICYELNNHFKRWTANKYDGELIPRRNSGFQCYRDPDSFDSSKNIHSFWQMPSSGAIFAGCVGAAALAATAYVSYRNAMR